MPQHTHRRRVCVCVFDTYSNNIKTVLIFSFSFCMQWNYYWHLGTHFEITATIATINNSNETKRTRWNEAYAFTELFKWITGGFLGFYVVAKAYCAKLNGNMVLSCHQREYRRKSLLFGRVLCSLPRFPLNHSRSSLSQNSIDLQIILPLSKFVIPWHRAAASLQLDGEQIKV